MDDDGSAGDGARLGLDGFAVLTAAEVDGELHQLVETTAARVGCPACGVVAVGHGRRRAWVRELPAGGRPVALLWAKRVWRCADGDCHQGTWAEQRLTSDHASTSSTHGTEPSVTTVSENGQVTVFRSRFQACASSYRQAR